MEQSSFAARAAASDALSNIYTDADTSKQQQQQLSKLSLSDTSVATTSRSIIPLLEEEDDGCLQVEGIKFMNYTDESQLGDIMRLVGRDLSEPYSSEFVS
jgi:hypothetical protein